MQSVPGSGRPLLLPHPRPSQHHGRPQAHEGQRNDLDFVRVVSLLDFATDPRYQN